MTYWILGIVIVILGTLIFLLNQKLQILRAKVIELNEGVKNLSIVGETFPEFVKRGEDITRHLMGDLKVREEALKKLIIKAAQATKELEYLEGKTEEDGKNSSHEMSSQILILFNQGFNVEEISERLNIPIGEVELIVNLRRFSDTGEEVL